MFFYVIAPILWIMVALWVKRTPRLNDIQKGGCAIFLILIAVICSVLTFL
jgi:uncharacterized membrane protein YhaH (DUF805 family)